MNKLKKTRFTGVYTFESPTKRHHGRPDIAYYITFKVNGKKIWEPVGWASKEMTAVEASKRRSARMAEIERSGIVEKKKTTPITFNEAWQKYLENHLRLTKSERRITSMYNAGVKPVFGGMYLSEITPMALDKFKAEKLSIYAPATVRHYLTIIQAVFRKMEAWGYWAGPIPNDKIKVPRKDNRRLRFLTVQEADYLLDMLCLKSSTTWAMATISLQTGMRFGEIAMLRGEHVDLVQKRIGIVDGKGVLTRAVPLTREVRRILLSLRPRAGELIFPSRFGTVRNDVPDTYARTVAESGLNDGIKDDRYKVVFHTLRHTYASWLVQAGIPLYTVGELLGHSSVEMTRRYAHLSPDSSKNALTALEKTLSGS